MFSYQFENKRVRSCHLAKRTSILYKPAARRADVKDLLTLDSLVYLEWEDSNGCSRNWEDLPEVGEPEVAVCKSVGWVFRKSDRVVVIVPHLAQSAKLGINQGCGDMTIPLAAILRVNKLLGAELIKSLTTRLAA
jgi:hypothetical protein